MKWSSLAEFQGGSSTSLLPRPTAGVSTAGALGEKSPCRLGGVACRPTGVRSRAGAAGGGIQLRVVVGARCRELDADPVEAIGASKANAALDG